MELWVFTHSFGTFLHTEYVLCCHCAIGVRSCLTSCVAFAFLYCFSLQKMPSVLWDSRVRDEGLSASLTEPGCLKKERQISCLSGSDVF